MKWDTILQPDIKRNVILQTAVKKNVRPERIGEKCYASFSLVDQCIRAISLSDLTEEEKIEKLIQDLQSFWNGTSHSIVGCQRVQLQNIASLVFGIRSKKDNRLSTELRDFKFNELYLYYSYIERLVKKDNNYVFELLNENYEKAMKKKKELAELQKTAAKIAEQKKLEEQKKAEEEKRAKMKKEDRWKLEICEENKDISYFQQLEKSIYDKQDTIIIAGILKDYWIQKNKWEKDKINQKQKTRILKIKEILGE